MFLQRDIGHLIIYRPEWQLRDQNKQNKKNKKTQLKSTRKTKLGKLK